MVSVKFANKDCNVFNGSSKIEYGYNGGESSILNMGIAQKLKRLQAMYMNLMD